MANEIKKSIFEMTPEEFEARLAPVGLAAKQKALDMAAWHSFKTNCVLNRISL